MISKNTKPDTAAAAVAKQNFSAAANRIFRNYAVAVMKKLRRCNPDPHPQPFPKALGEGVYAP
jgi:hypothetical protein